MLKDSYNPIINRILQNEEPPVSDLSIENEIDLNFMRALLREAGEISLGQRGQMTASVKADHSPVTEVDHQVEDFLIERISSRYPAHQILSEESGLHHARATYVWVIDPIDGTRAFASGLPIWGTSIGILREGIPVAGGLYLPVSNEIYWGTRQAAYYNDQRLAPVKTVDLDSSLVFLGVPSNFHLHFKIAVPAHPLTGQHCRPPGLCRHRGGGWLADTQRQPVGYRRNAAPLRCGGKSK